MADVVHAREFFTNVCFIEIERMLWVVRNGHLEINSLQGFFKDVVVADFSATTHFFVHRDQWAAGKLEGCEAFCETASVALLCASKSFEPVSDFIESFFASCLCESWVHLCVLVGLAGN